MNQKPEIKKVITSEKTNKISDSVIPTVIVQEPTAFEKIALNTNMQKNSNENRLKFLKYILLVSKGKLIMIKKLKWVGGIIGASYILTCISMFSLQKKLIYTPVSEHPKNRRVKKIYSADGKLLALDFDREDSEQTLIVFHGRDRNAGYRSYFSRVFGRKSRLLVIEYPGFGENNKDKLNKKNILKHCHEAMLHILSIIEGPFTIVGESLGSGIASEMAAFYQLPKLILITPYSTLADVAQNKFWFLPVKTLLQENYDSVKNLKNYDGKVLFVISEKDKLVPAKFGKKLLNSFQGNKEEIFVLEASHYDWWEKMNTTQKNIFKAFYEFV